MLSFSQTVLKIIFITTAYIVLALPSSDLFATQSYEIGIIIANNLNVRPEPEMENTPVDVLKKGAKVIILEHLNGWYKVKHQGQIGYIKNQKQYVRTIFVEENEEINISESDSSAIDRYKKEAEKINRKIEKGKIDVLTFSRNESDIVNSLNDIDLELNRARKRISATKSGLLALEKKIAETTDASKQLMQQIQANENYASERMVALYKLNWLGKIQFLASAQSMYEFFQRKKNMELILAYDETVRQKLLVDRAKLQEVLETLNVQKMERLSLEADFKKEVVIMSQERTKRQELLNDIRNKKALELAAIESLKQAANDLNQAITSLSLKSDKPEQIIKKLPENFPSLKGLLNMPVNGKIISFFGQYINDKLNVVNFRSGIEIKADRGEPIRAIFDGRVLYADWFKGYGNMIIIDHGKNYYSVYAHAEELFTSKGDTVEMDEVVATVGDSGSMVGPALHFEVRHHGKPVDPLEWIKEG